MRLLCPADLVFCSVELLCLVLIFFDAIVGVLWTFFCDYSHGEPHSHGATILQIPFLELHGYPWLPVANVAPWLNRQGISHIKIDPGAIELHN